MYSAHTHTRTQDLLVSVGLGLCVFAFDVSLFWFFFQETKLSASILNQSESIRVELIHSQAGFKS